MSGRKKFKRDWPKRWQASGVDALMLRQIAGCYKPFVTHLTHKRWLASGVHALVVLRQMAGWCKPLATHLTHKRWLASGVDAVMYGQSAGTCKWFYSGCEPFVTDFLTSSSWHDSFVFCFLFFVFCFVIFWFFDFLIFDLVGLGQIYLFF